MARRPSAALGHRLSSRLYGRKRPPQSQPLTFIFMDEGARREEGGLVPFVRRR
jgi:hypothetical protein